MKTLVDQANRIRKPLSLAALALLIVSGVIKGVLELHIFGSLSEGHTYDLLNTIVIGVFILAALALVGGIVAYSVDKHAVRAETVELIEVILDERSRYFPTLDIRLANHSHRLASFTRVDIAIEDAREIFYCDSPLFKLVEVSETCAAYLSPDLKGKTVSVPLHVDVEPDSGDRIALLVGTTYDAKWLMEVWYTVKLTLFYDQSHETLESDRLVFSVLPAIMRAGSTHFSGQTDGDCIKRNQGHMVAVAGLNAVKSMRVQGLILETRAHVPELFAGLPD